MGVAAYLSLIGRGRGGRLFEAGRLLTFCAFRVGAYSRWALIRGWALIRINAVFTSQYYTCQLFLGFHLVITRVSRNVPATSADFRRLSEDFRTLRGYKPYFFVCGLMPIVDPPR